MYHTDTMNSPMFKMFRHDPEGLERIDRFAAAAYERGRLVVCRIGVLIEGSIVAVEITKSKAADRGHFAHAQFRGRAEVAWHPKASGAFMALFERIQEKAKSEGA